MSRSKKYFTVSVIFLFFTATFLLSQSTDFIKFQNYSVEHGLSVSVVQDFTQDQNGFIWIATQDGLNRFDGYSFKTYYNDPTLKTTLRDNDNRSIQVDKNGHIWLGNNSGVDRFNPFDETFENYSPDPDDENSLAGNVIWDIVRDPSGDIWIATPTGLSRYNYESNDFKTFKNNPNDSKSIAGNAIRKLFVDHQGVLWVPTNNGLDRYNAEDDSFTHFKHDPNNKFSLENPLVARITEDISNRLWLITRDSRNRNHLSVFDRKSNRFLTMKNSPNLFASFPDNIEFTDFATDRNKNIWLVTRNGLLARYDNGERNFVIYQHDDLNPNTIPNNRVQSVFVDRSNLVYVGTFGAGFSILRYERNKHFSHVRRDPNTTNTIIGTNVLGIYEQRNGIQWFGSINGGLTRYDPKRNRYTQFLNTGARTDKMAHNSTNAILEDNSNNVWLATPRGLMRYVERRNTFEIIRINPTANNPNGTGVNDLLQDKDNNIWLATNTGLGIFDPASKTMKKFYAADSTINTPTNRSIRRMVEGQEGILWLGTFNGVEKFDRYKEEFELFRHDPNDNTSLSTRSVLSLHLDKENILWVGTDNGLNELIKGSKKFKRYGVKEGLPNSVIYGILEDNNNNLWMSTNIGISQYNYSDNVFRNFDIRDGLQSNEFNYNSYHKGFSGKMYFGGVNGATVFDPDNIIINQTEPNIVFTEFKINYQEYELESGFINLNGLSLAYNENTISFELSALELTIPQKNMYQYKLEGFDENWITTNSNRRFITYTNLNPEDYVLKIKAANHDGVWTQTEKIIPISIVPHFTQTLWFRISVIAFIVIAVVLAFYFKNKIEKRRQEALEKEVRDRTKELRENKDELEKENDIRKQTEVALLKARGETDAILANVSEGLFLLDKELIISDQHSQELEDIFEEKNLSKFEFVELMRPLITAKNLEALKDFVELLFNPDIDEEVVNELNPLDQIEVHFEEAAGNFNTKYLEFLFRRILNEEDDIYSLLVTVRDVTEVIELQRELEESRRKNQYEMQQLLSILRVEPSMLRNFLNNVKVTINQISNTFKRDEEKSKYKALLKTVYRTIHNLKGNAGLLDLKFFVDKFHTVEEIINKLQEQDVITGDDFLPILFEFDELMKYMTSMNELIDRVVSMSQKIKKGENVESEYKQDVFIESVNDIIMRMGNDLGKKAKLIVENEKNFEIPSKLRDAFKDIVIQLVRNSMVHGIETQEERRSHNKQESATLKLSLEESNGKFTFKYRDDGKGLDIDKIKEKAMDTGKFIKDDLDKMTNSQIARLIFNDGLSTAEKTSEHAGRGEGMSVIKEIVAKNKGKMKFSFANGKFFEMGFEIPVA